MFTYLRMFVLAVLMFLMPGLSGAAEPGGVSFDTGYKLVKLLRKHGQPEKELLTVAPPSHPEAALVMYTIRSEGSMPAFSIGIAWDERYLGRDGLLKHCGIMVSHQYVASHSREPLHVIDVGSVDNCLPPEIKVGMLLGGDIDRAFANIVAHMLDEMTNPPL